MAAILSRPQCVKLMIKHIYCGWCNQSNYYLLIVMSVICMSISFMASLCMASQESLINAYEYLIKPKVLLLLNVAYEYYGNTFTCWLFHCVHDMLCWCYNYQDLYDDVIKWKHFPRYWPFVRGIHRFPVNSPHKGQWRGALMFSLIFVWINDWVNNREAGDLRR